jgi:hypothetical protein
MRTGHFEGVQPLVSSVLTHTVNNIFDIEKLAEARADWKREDPMEGKLGFEFRYRTIFRSFARCLERADRNPPPGFNRGASVGHFNLHAQLTPPNALAALLLVVAVTRELSYIFSALDEAEEPVAAPPE